MIPDVFIWTVNWLHYLNYERHSKCRSSIKIVIRTHSRLTVFLTKGKRVFHVSILYLFCSANSYASRRLSCEQASIYCPCHTYYITLLVFVCLYVHTSLATTSPRLSCLYPPPLPSRRTRCPSASRIPSFYNPSLWAPSLRHGANSAITYSSARSGL